jgi:uncharacterized protein
MDVTPLIRRDTKIIQGYKYGVFKVSGESFSQSIIVSANKISHWPYAQIKTGQDLTVEHFKAIYDHDPEIEIVLVGTGQTQYFIPMALRALVKQTYGFSIEPMDNGAASRTYNVLIAEGRPVAILLLCTPFK